MDSDRAKAGFNLLTDVIEEPGSVQSGLKVSPKGNEEEKMA